MNRFLQGMGALLLIVFVFVIVNVAGKELMTGMRLDLTQDKLFTLTPGTQKILEAIPERIDLYFFYSAAITGKPLEVRRYARQVKETLEVYQRQAPDRIVLHVIDPQTSSKDAEYAAKLGLQAVRISAANEPLYFGLAGTNAQGNVQIIPFFQEDNENALEYQLSLLVQQLAQPKPPILGLMSGLPIEGEVDSKTGKDLKPWLLLDSLGKRYKIEVLPVDTEQIPPSINVLMIVHPKKLSTATLFAIDQFVMSGGRVLAFVDPYSEQDLGSTYFGVPSLDRSSDLGVLFKAWGLEMEQGKVVGDSRYALEASRDPREQSVRLPTALGLSREALSYGDISISGLAVINMTTAGVLRAIEGSGTRFTPLIHSSSYSTLFDAHRLTKLVAPGELMKELTPDGGREYVMAARIRGSVTSAFPDGIDGHSQGSKATTDINVIVVADTDLLTDRIWAQSSDFYGRQVLRPWADNEKFVANALDDLFDADELIPARNRGIANRTFNRVESFERQVPVLHEREAALRQRLAILEDKLKVINITLIPLLFIIVFLSKCIVARLMKRSR